MACVLGGLVTESHTAVSEKAVLAIFARLDLGEG